AALDRDLAPAAERSSHEVHRERRPAAVHFDRVADLPRAPAFDRRRRALESPPVRRRGGEDDLEAVPRPAVPPGRDCRRVVEGAGSEGLLRHGCGFGRDRSRIAARSSRRPGTDPPERAATGATRATARRRAHGPAAFSSSSSRRRSRARSVLIHTPKTAPATPIAEPATAPAIARVASSSLARTTATTAAAPSVVSAS